jgi:hypothetical protein
MRKPELKLFYCLVWAMMLVLATSCSDKNDDNPGGGGNSEIIPPKDYNELVQVIKKLEKTGYISEVTTGIGEESKKPYVSFFYLQPIDHNKEWTAGNEDSMWQKVVVVDYVGPNAITVLATNGYAIASDKRCPYPDLAKDLNANVIEVEHRYAGRSITDDMDWQYNVATQESADLYRIIQYVFKANKICNGKWVASGTSKSGMTATFLAMHYPDVCDLYVPFCAPFCKSYDDKRIMEYHNNTTYKDHPEAIKEAWKSSWNAIIDVLQNESLKEYMIQYHKAYLISKKIPSVDKMSKDQLLCSLMTYFHGHQFEKANYAHVSDWKSMIPDRIDPKYVFDASKKYDKDVLDYMYWYLMMNHDTLENRGIETAPDKNKVPNTTTSYSRTRSKEDAYANHYTMQCIFELGHYHFDYSREWPYLTENQKKILEGNADEYNEPYKNYTKYWKPIEPKVKEFVKTTKSKIIFVYGENDCWTGAGIQEDEIPASQRGHIKRFLVPDGVHNDDYLESNYSSDPNIGKQISSAIREALGMKK